MNVKFLFLTTFFGSLYKMCCTETVTFINTEHPVVTFFDKTVLNNLSMTSHRVSRQDPRHYVHLYVDILVIVNNSIKLDFYFYQLLTNRYRPSFVQMHFSWCDMVRSDSFFGSAIRDASKDSMTCPLPPGVYDFQNMTVGFVPKGFPFTKGRIYCNASLEYGGKSKVISSAHINMEVKKVQLYVKTKKNQN